MKYIKTPVYEFDELSEQTKQKVIDKERTLYFDCMFEDDLHLWLFDSDKCPLINSGVSIDSLKDLSYDLSNYQYDHVAFRECTLDKDVLIEKSGVMEFIENAWRNTSVSAQDYIDNISISWSLPYARDYFCTSGHVAIDDCAFYNDKFEDMANAISEELEVKLSEYMHDLQQKLYDYLIDNVDHATSDETIIENLDPDMVYDAQGNSYTREEMEMDMSED